MLINIRYATFLVVLFLACSFKAFAYKDLGPTVNLFKIDSIKIEGVKKVETEAILEKIDSKKGMVLDNYLLRKDIQKIYGMKYFEYVEAHHEVQQGKNVLIFRVQEKPIINEIIINGASEIDQDDLISQMKSKEFSILDVNTVKADVKALQKHYEDKGFYLAAISYRIQKKNKENVDLIFDIKEYDKVKVKKIIYLGNNAFSDQQLKDIMQTREESLLSFMSGSGNFKEFDFQTDIERLKYFYRTKGYLQVNVGTPEITVSEDKRWLFITVKLTEGPQFSINKISFQGEVLFDEDLLFKKILLKEGDIYSEEKYRQDVQKLTEMYQDKGYAFVNVLRNLRMVPGENKVDVEYSFEKGKIAYFGKVTIKGNTKTRDKVILRELKIQEGSKYSGTNLRLSKENVNRLGFFEPGSVVFRTVTPKGKDDVLDVEITIKETHTGQISMGAGYSTATGPFAQASIAQTNFNGLGQNLSLSFSWADHSRVFNLGFTEPYLMDTKWTAGGDIFYSDNSQSIAYSYSKKGADARVGYPIFEYTRLYFTYKIEDTTLRHVDDPTIDKDVENGITSSVRTAIVRDKRDNRMQPSKGYYINAAYEFAGVGGDKKWSKIDFDGQYFHRVYKDLVFRSRLYGAKLNTIGGRQVPRSEKFSLGGSRNLRGYNFEDIGPTVVAQNSFGVWRKFNRGGQFTLFSQLELEHPLAREAGLKWVVFFDAGNVYEKYMGAGGNYSLFFDYGFGLRWFSPIGVLRFEFGYPLGNKSKGTGMKFHFDIGQIF